MALGAHLGSFPRRTQTARTRLLHIDRRQIPPTRRVGEGEILSPNRLRASAVEPAFRQPGNASGCLFNVPQPCWGISIVLHSLLSDRGR